MSEFVKGFHVITMISNTVRYESRWKLYKRFAEHMEKTGARLWTCEVAFGDRPFEITDANNPQHLQLRTINELWHKERALNLMVNRVTEQFPDWKYVAWVDADIEFQSDQWIAESVHQLQHYEVVQLFQNAVDLGPTGEALAIHYGFAYSYRTGREFKQGYSNWHPGFAWAITREAYDKLPFLDIGILGSGDRHMAGAWIHKVEETVSKEMSGPYLRELQDYQRQAERYIRRDIGYVPGMIQHFWHGKKRDRRYQDRWKILTETQFDPDKDIRPDSYGLYQLVDHGDIRSIELRDRIRDYFRMRNEDSIDLE